ncbi:MAG: hypothetical protein M3032_01480 [Verrucomicrobiota bacterium]|nr:hypothetical protein [Verrucomicrobiota bacterium]
MVEQIEQQLKSLVAGQLAVKFTIRLLRVGEAGELLRRFLHGFMLHRQESISERFRPRRLQDFASVSAAAQT